MDSIVCFNSTYKKEYLFLYLKRFSFSGKEGTGCLSRLCSPPIHQLTVSSISRWSRSARM